MKFSLLELKIVSIRGEEYLNGFYTEERETRRFLVSESSVIEFHQRNETEEEKTVGVYKKEEDKDKYNEKIAEIMSYLKKVPEYKRKSFTFDENIVSIELTEKDVVYM